MCRSGQGSGASVSSLHPMVAARSVAALPRHSSLPGLPRATATPSIKARRSARRAFLFGARGRVVQGSDFSRESAKEAKGGKERRKAERRRVAMIARQRGGSPALADATACLPTSWARIWRSRGTRSRADTRSASCRIRLNRRPPSHPRTRSELAYGIGNGLPAIRPGAAIPTTTNTCSFAGALPGRLCCSSIQPVSPM